MASPLRALTSIRSPQTAPAGDASRDRRPDLRVVPGRRRFAWFAMFLMVMVTGLLLGATYLHTRIAERQLEIDRLDAAMQTAQEEFDVLRAERAVLRSPTRLANEAAALGMHPGEESEFVAIDPMLLAVTIARTGQLPTTDQLAPGSYARLEPLDQFRLVKNVSQETP
ncbi:MAG: hypothetical protein CL424_11910 [Acidimicrobiaceae bacterium]|nr:hypothetical protein [Acidimicrobiaceae bacterium]